MKDNTIKVIFFDLGNVIIKVDPYRLEKGFSSSGKVKEGEVVRYFNDSDNMNRYMEGKLTSSQFYSKTRRIFRLDLKYRKFYELWNSVFDPFPEMEGIIRSLKRDYPEIKLILLSNTNESHYGHIRNKFDILELFDGYVLSHEVGAQKPSPAIFKYALKKAGALPKESFYTDDRLDLIEAARVMGIRAYQFTGEKELKRQLSTFGIIV